MSRTSFCCPFCFERKPLTEIWFRCACGADMNIDGDLLDKNGKRVGKTGDRKKGIKEKLGLRKLPSSVKCTSCKKDMAVKKICPNPNCAEELPNYIDIFLGLYIAVIGTKQSGKSHYIATLIDRLKTINDDFNWKLTRLDTQTERRYNNYFYNPLYIGKTLLPATRKVTDQEDVSHPLLYQLDIRQRSIMLALFDTAGEDLHSEEDKTPAIVKQYIANASGIICLLDPFRFPKVWAAKKKDPFPYSRDDSPGEILTKVSNYIIENLTKQGRRPPVNPKFPVSLAMAFSKIDAIDDGGTANAVLLPQKHDLFQNTRHRGLLHHGEFTNIQDVMKGWIKEVDKVKTILSASKSFKRVAFFGVTALGKSLQNEVLVEEPKPERVEDPFLWILHQHGLIRMGGFKDPMMNMWHAMRYYGSSIGDALYALVTKVGMVLLCCGRALGSGVRKARPLLWATAGVLCVTAGIWYAARFFTPDSSVTNHSVPAVTFTPPPVVKNMGGGGTADKSVTTGAEKHQDAVASAATFSKSGDAHHARGDYDAAIKDHGMAIQQYNQALSLDATKVVEINTSLARTYQNRGVAHFNKGDFDSAISDYKKALPLAPSRSRTAEIDVELANAYHSHGNKWFDDRTYTRAIWSYDMAIEKYEEARSFDFINLSTKLKPRLATVYIHRGNTYSAKSDYDAAINDYMKAVDLDFTRAPEINRLLASAYKSRGDVYWYKGDDSKSRKDYEQAIRYDSTLRSTLQSRMKQESAPAPARVTEDPDAYVRSGQLKHNTGNYDGAINDFSVALGVYVERLANNTKRAPEVASLYNKRGRAYKHLRNYHKAIEDYSNAIKVYEKAISLDPKLKQNLSSDLASVYHNRGLVYFDNMNNSKEANKDCNKVLELNANAENDPAFKEFRGKVSKALRDKMWLIKK